MILMIHVMLYVIVLYYDMLYNIDNYIMCMLYYMRACVRARWRDAQAKAPRCLDCVPWLARWFVRCR